PYPVSTALAALNGTSITGATQTEGTQAIELPPGVSLSETTSGYPIITGTRAVDSPPVVIPYNGGPMEEALPQPIGRNGLLANPCSDPISAHGAAYGRSY